MANDRGTRVLAMTAVVRREDARSVCVTGAVGALVIAIAIVMMVLSAPAHAHARPHGPVVLSSQTVSRMIPWSGPGAAASRG
jgi:hypothetical protein